MCERTLGIERAAEAHAAEERKAIAAFEQEPYHLQEILVPAHGDAVLGHTAEAGHHAVVQRLIQCRCVANRRKRRALAGNRDTRQRRRQRLDLESVDADDRMAVIQQVVRQRESRRSHADDKHALARARREEPDDGGRADSSA